ncbi:DUF2505 domain-containing protein [Nocardioides sp. zg-536]|uniref:DUF2505 domain-containing protein n=1 Tax=Nocardioides faecalis TaxID=2803858 RepID=A0A939BXA1_9ACTN|nr:DUF2505 domain-containing protein [Nocardioides faecalis]MBM9461502.1 DUF2505 domain-containing protein [Nocardioides faecalis]MBS4752588.1 DUF2505 domain-containing protein [Nocardioides faecalis]QVI57867.1 DUF2505 domain-containing protein [Nocardioides faecalis]
MATRLLQEQVYDAPLAQVSAMLTDRAFREQVCTAQHALDQDVTVTPNAGGTTVHIEMTQPTEGVPGFAKKIVGESTTVVQTETWTSPEHADIVVTIPGKPGEIRGTATLVEVGGVTTETIDLSITVKIPLISGKLEDLLAKLLRSALRAEQRTGTQWLAG